jgi:hypothetical protein
VGKGVRRWGEGRESGGKEGEMGKGERRDTKGKKEMV